MGQFKKELPICNEWQKEIAVSLVSTDTARTYLEPHYGNGVFGNVTFQLDNTKW